MGELINCPQLTADQFYAVPNGTRVYNNGGDQCVALANQYVVGTLNLPLPVGIQSARQWWDNYDADPRLHDNYVQISEAPQQGDIFVGIGNMYPPPHGHIGVVSRTWNGQSFGTMEQNAGTGAARWLWRYDRNYRDIMGFLRPKSLIPPEPEPERDEDMYARVMYENGWNGLWNMATGEVAWIGNDADNRRFTDNLKTYVFKDGLELDAFKARYPFLLPKTDLSSVSINVDALAEAIAQKLGGGTTPDVTTKQDILSAIETNYPENV